jgi:hypothetical protein
MLKNGIKIAPFRRQEGGDLYLRVTLGGNVMDFG